MNPDLTNDGGQRTTATRFSFGVGNLLMVVAIVAICIAWWVDHNRTTPPAGFDVPGPISVSYTVRTSPNSTSGQKIGGALGINFHGDTIVIYTGNGGNIISSKNLIDFRWQPE